MAGFDEPQTPGPGEDPPMTNWKIYWGVLFSALSWTQPNSTSGCGSGGVTARSRCARPAEFVNATPTS